MKRSAHIAWWRCCGALLVLCLLLPLAVCLCAHEDDDCADAAGASCDCVCFHHGHLAVTPDVPPLLFSAWCDRAVPPAAPERALLLTAAIFRPPIA